MYLKGQKWLKKQRQKKFHHCEGSTNGESYHLMKIEILETFANWLSGQANLCY